MFNSRMGAALAARLAVLSACMTAAAAPALAQTDTAAPAGVSGMTKDEVVAGIIKACTDNPDQKGCVDLRNACNAQRGAWKADMIRICPALVGPGGGTPSASVALDEDDGGETFGEPRPRDKHEATLDKVARSCRANPGQGMCTSARDQCLAKYATMPAGGQRFCRQL
ncbi:MAG: hypothetical protein FJ100_18875 [Deltaproteobacteria bacterium]|nr:hypothetical protein [Deltaproteobacteria bacterium]